MNVVPITTFDLFYLSYDEPKCEEFFADLRRKAPWAKRVHGVEGFHAAHQRCAQLSDTDYFITIDGDNIVRDEFFDITIDRSKLSPNTILSWASRNVVNGLRYGNGSTKLWSKNRVLEMRTHETSVEDEGASAVEFCFDPNYVANDEIYSDTYPNGSEYQAYRAGFREGVKMLLNQGRRVTRDEIHTLYATNIRRLEAWCSVGSDVENGLWCIFGAREGALKAMDHNFDLRWINSFSWFESYWDFVKGDYFKNPEPFSFLPYNKEKLINDINELGEKLFFETGIRVSLLDENASQMVKNGLY